MDLKGWWNNSPSVYGYSYMPKGMTQFKCTYRTPYGVIVVEGKRENEEVHYSYSVPEGIRITE